MRPFSIRKLRAAMELKDLSLYDVSQGCGLSYYVVSRILNDSFPGADLEGKLAKVSEFIETHPDPEEAAL